jgi:PAS domain S-box-containing protein
MAGARQPRKKRAASGAADELRRQAEERLDRLSADAAAAAASPVPEDAAAIVHELRVHQIELEMQNEELRRAQLELAASREKYFELFDLAPVGYLTLNDNSIVSDANLTAAHLLGVERQLLVGQPFTAFVFAPDRDVFYLHQRVLQKTGEARTFELRLQRVGGDGGSGHFWAHLEGRPRRDADGRTLSVWVAFTDVDAQVVAAEEILHLKDDLEDRVLARTAELGAANRELEAFVYSASHDLRAPLRAIDGFSQMVIEDAAERLEAADLEHLQRVRAAAERMALLIDGLLVLSRVARKEMLRESVDLSAMAKSVIADLRSAQPGRRVEALVQPNLVVDADLTLLNVIMTNLLSNSWKFTSKHEAARIEFGVTDADGERAFFVKDDGAGFDMSQAEHLFGAFQRLHTDAEFEGNGIGLATVQRLAARHGGHVWAEAEVEKGATFFFTLPEAPGTD